MSEEVISKVCDLLDQIIQQNNGINWDMVSAIANWVTPIVTTILSFFLGRKIEKQKNTVSEANFATLDLIKGKNEATKENIINYIKACINVNTEQVARFFTLTEEETLMQLNELENQGKIKHIRAGTNKQKWIWQSK